MGRPNGGGDAWFDRVEAGCKATTPFQKMFWGVVTDPFGMHWGIDEPAKP